MTNDPMLKAMEEADAAKAAKLFEEMVRRGEKAWDIHLSLFPLVQRVLNPPFINPHLPKMYCICGELKPYLTETEIPSFVHLEVMEYSRRPKLEELSKVAVPSSPVSFGDIETAIRSEDRKAAAIAMAGFLSQRGASDLARRLLVLGSAYLSQSLGHSVSCTAFILLELLARPKEDPWPALAALADYFCKGKFAASPALRRLAPFSPDEAIKHHLSRAVSGRGIVNLHHAITVYAMERVRHLFDEKEYGHMIDSWITFLGNKSADSHFGEDTRAEPITSYDQFYELFSALEAKPLSARVGRMIGTPEGRQNLSRFFVKGLCDRHRGNYNPHCITGLGAALWVLHRFADQPALAMRALFQYTDFLFDSIKSGN